MEGISRPGRIHHIDGEGGHLDQGLRCCGRHGAAGTPGQNSHISTGGQQSAQDFLGRRLRHPVAGEEIGHDRRLNQGKKFAEQITLPGAIKNDTLTRLARQSGRRKSRRIGIVQMEDLGTGELVGVNIGSVQGGDVFRRRQKTTISRCGIDEDTRHARCPFSTLDSRNVDAELSKLVAQEITIRVLADAGDHPRRHPQASEGGHGGGGRAPALS